MTSFFKLKKKFLEGNYLPRPFKKFRFIHFYEIDQNNFLKLLNSRRVRKHFFLRKKISKKDHSRYVDNYLQKPIINFVLIEKKTRAIVGIFNLKNTKLGIEIGKYILNENFLKKKIAKQATANLIDFFFKSFNKKKIYAKTKTDNYINLNLNSKLGFIIKDHDRKFYIMELTNVRFYNFYLKKR